jgi:hypothetical protein
MHPYFHAFMLQRFVYTFQVYSCLSGNVYKRNIIFWGYFMIYSNETIGKAETCRQSKAIAQAGLTKKNAVARATLPLSFNSKMAVEILAC